MVCWLSLVALLAVPAASAMRVETAALEAAKDGTASQMARAALDKDYFVFLEVYMLAGDWWHSEVTICPKESLASQDQQHLSKLLEDQFIKQYVEVPVAWWEARSAVGCYSLAYGSTDSQESCSGVSMVAKGLAERRAANPDADVQKVHKYFYGTSDKSAEQVYDQICKTSCGSDWSGEKYDRITRNCDRWAFTVLKCGLGLSGGNTMALGAKPMHTTFFFQCPSCV